MQTAPMRERQLNIRLSDQEAARLDRVAEHYGLNAAGVIRMLVKREHDAIVASTPPPAPSTPPPPTAKKKRR